ncbi:MAG: PTS glucitol/sorbitol transporter subunit IIA [Microbacteriaceae bacterium]
MTELWAATVTSVGVDAQEMRDAGVIILFGDPVPPALAEVSIVHAGGSAPSRAISAGDTFTIDDSVVQVTAVGEIANENLSELGHIVVYLNPAEDKILPGAVHAIGELTIPQAGSVLKFMGD